MTEIWHCTFGFEHTQNSINISLYTYLKIVKYFQEKSNDPLKKFSTAARIVVVSSNIVSM